MKSISNLELSQSLDYICKVRPVKRILFPTFSHYHYQLLGTIRGDSFEVRSFLEVYDSIDDIMSIIILKRRFSA